MRFKLVGCLSTAFIYFISINPVVAIDVIPNKGSRSTQAIAIDPLRIIEREQRRLEREQGKKERQERIELQRQERERQRLKRQQELSDGNKLPTQTPPNSSPRNRPSRQAPATFSQKELEYLNTLAPDERQLYEIIHKAKRGIKDQQIADFLGSGFGITANGTHQTAQDLDREFQNALRDARSGKVASTGKPGNQLLQRILNKRSNETPDQWYKRTNFLIFYTSGEYELWRATLSAAQKQAYDTSAQKRRSESMKEVDGALSDEIRRDLSCKDVLQPDGDYVRVCKE